ncbi:MAG: hypothetical protein ACJ788_06470 [Ktedonobacteraceae bacterium]
MQSTLSGLNLADLLVRISCGESLPAAQPSVAGRRSHMLMLALLGVAERGDHGWTYCVNLVGHSVALAPMPTARKN